jgi:hypothetical protein
MQPVTSPNRGPLLPYEHFTANHIAFDLISTILLKRNFKKGKLAEHKLKWFRHACFQAEKAEDLD